MDCCGQAALCCMPGTCMMTATFLARGRPYNLNSMFACGCALLRLCCMTWVAGNLCSSSPTSAVAHCSQALHASSCCGSDNMALTTWCFLLGWMGLQSLPASAKLLLQQCWRMESLPVLPCSLLPMQPSAWLPPQESCTSGPDSTSVRGNSAMP